MKNILNSIKNGLKAVLLVLVLIVGTKTQSIAQCPGNVDLEATSIDPSATTVAVGQTVQIIVAMQNNGPCAIPIGEATCQITLSSVAFDLGVPINFADFAVPPQWSYLGAISNATQHNLFFQNNAGEIPAMGGFYFQFDVVGKAIAVNSPITLVSSLSGTATSSDINSTNQSASTTLTVTTPLAIKLSDFAGAIHDCAASLSWKSTNEENFDRFEIEFSADGRTYQNVGTVKGQNTGASGSYKFNYPQQTIKGFYRLKMVDKKGNINYSKVVKLTNTCKEVKAFVYPNPVAAMQDANVVLQNFGNKVEGILYDAAGKQLRVVKLANGSNKLNLQQYTGGNYLLNIKDENNTAVSVRITVAR